MIALQTPRLRLVPFALADVPAIRAFVVDPEVRRWMCDGKAIDEAVVRGWVRDSERDFRGGGAGMWRIEVRGEDGAPLDRCAGFAGIRPSRISRDPMLAAAVAPRWFGRAVATEACRLVLRDGFGRCGYPRIVAGTDWNNAPSRALIRRLGFTPWRASPGFFGAVVWFALDGTPTVRAERRTREAGP